MTVRPDIFLPSGIYTPVVTFFKNEGTLGLDIESQVKHALHLYESGIQGLLVSGSLGENVHLTKEERKSLIAALRKEIPDKAFKLIAGLPPMGSISDVATESTGLYEAGADYLIVLTPGYFGPALTSQEGLVEYFSQVANKSSLPVIIYNFPGTSNNVTLTPDSITKLSLHSNIVGIKLTHLNFDVYTLLGDNKAKDTKKNFTLLTGLGLVLVPSLSLGLQGAIDGLSALFPKTMNYLFRLFHEGEMKTALELQTKIVKANGIIADLNAIGVKFALNHYYGIGEVICRPPLAKNLSYDSFAKYESDLDTIFSIEASLNK